MQGLFQKAFLPLVTLECISMRTRVTGDTKRGVTYGDSCHSSSRIGELPVCEATVLSWISAGRLFFLALGSGGSHSGKLFFLLRVFRWACWWEQCCRGGGSSRLVWLSPATVCETNDIFVILLYLLAYWKIFDSLLHLRQLNMIKLNF